MSPAIVVRIDEALTVPVDDQPRRQVVMIVDDERVIADTLSAIFTAHGYTVMTAYDGESAMQQAQVVPPELLITDVMMPGMTGVELAIAIKLAIPDTKTMLFSGQAATMDLLVEAREMGYDFATVSKPVHPTEMLRRAKEVLVAA